MLEDFVILSNGVLQFALLDKLFRGAERFLFIKAKTKRHKLCGLQPFSHPTHTVSLSALPDRPEPRREIPGKTPQYRDDGIAKYSNCKAA